VRLVAEIRSRAVAPESDDVVALAALWRSVEKGADPAEAWTAVLTALFADPELAVY
jgi:hypothetical protein